MSNLYGFAGRTLLVDLDTGEVKSKPLSRELAEKFIGGLGTGARLAYGFMGRDVDPFSPGNPLVFSASPLVGTLAPAASRVHLISRSPVSGFLCYSNAGHSMGIMMKYAGYDHLVVTGRSEEPVYLRISDDEVEICNASKLWGRDAWEATDILRSDIGDYWVDCIGPGGENLVRHSIILCSKRSSFNKGGPGAVMGSKNLKAIAARGSKGVEVADPERFRRLTEGITRKILADPDLRMFRTYGGPYPRSPRPGFSHEVFQERVADRAYACPSCPVACKHLINLRNGRYEGLSFRVSHLAALANHNLPGGVEDWDELAKVVELENRYGLDASVTAGMLSYLVDCFEHGMLSEEAGLVLRRGGKYLRRLIEMTVRREGVGRLAAEGLKGAVEEMGMESERFAAHQKWIWRNHMLDRQVTVYNIGSMTNPRGGKSDFAHIPFGRENPLDLDPGVFRRFCADLGLPGEAADRVCDGPGGRNVGRMTKMVEDYSAAYNSMGFCNNLIVMRHIDLETLSELYEAATGIRMNSARLLESGERVLNLLKAFNVRMGATRTDDLPSRGAAWPSDEPLMVAGEEYGTLNQILDEYYDERGWNVKTGFPTKKKLKDLGLEEVAEDLEV